MVDNNFWRQCSSCKKPIGFNIQHYVCSVSTCTRKRTGFVFCSLPCWERHLPYAKHRDASAIREFSPKEREPSIENDQVIDDIKESNSTLNMGARRLVINTPSPKAPREILVVASKLKDYIRIKSEMNTSASVMSILSDILRELCDQAIDRARADGRKTVMDRDFEKQ